MRSRVGIAIRAPYERIFSLAAEVERWPERLPHYRYVRAVPDTAGERRFSMGARNGPIPVRWEAIQRPRRDERRIEFVHTGGVTRGMRVAWRFEERPDGVAVSIHHELELGWRLIGRVAADWVIGPLFVKPIARRTLRRIRALTEVDA
jgi:ribosome-associated toxin RatA of RatAB toxin-antitoxin module